MTIESEKLSALRMDGPPFTSMEELDLLVRSPWQDTPQSKIPPDWRTVAPNGRKYDIDTYVAPRPYQPKENRKPRKQNIGRSRRNSDWMRQRMEC